MKKSLFAVLIIMIFMSCSAGEDETETFVSENEQEAVDPIPVKIIDVFPEDFREYGHYYGTAVGVKRAVLSNRLGGEVEMIAVKEGDPVKAGMSLAEISSEKVENTYDLAVLSEKISRENYEVYQSYSKSGSASHLQADQAHLDWLNSKGALLDAEEIMEEAFCISPFDGTVLAINIREFEKLIPGDETFVIEDQSRMRITIGIPEGEMSGISEGNPADVTFSSCPGRSWEGTLLSYSRESSDQNLTYKAEIEVDNPDGAIMSGTTARVKLLRNIYEEKLVIPVETIRILGNKSYAMAVEDNTIVSREITAGPSDSRNVIILSGLKEGDRIVKEGIHLVNNGSSVKVMD